MRWRGGGYLRRTKVKKGRVVDGWSDGVGGGWERKSSRSCFPSGFSSSAVGNVLAYHRACCWKMQWFLTDPPPRSYTHTHTQRPSSSPIPALYYGSIQHQLTQVFFTPHIMCHNITIFSCLHKTLWCWSDNMSHEWVVGGYTCDIDKLVVFVPHGSLKPQTV